MKVKRTNGSIGFIGRDRHLFVFMPSESGGNYSGWGFHHRLRRNGEWAHWLLKLHVKPKRKDKLPGARQWRLYELTHWRSKEAVGGKRSLGQRDPSNRTSYKSYVRLKVCPGGTYEQERCRPVSRAQDHARLRGGR